MINFYQALTRRLLFLACFSILILLISQLLGRYVWQLELFSHFVPYYAVVLWLAVIFYPKTFYPTTFVHKKLKQKIRWLFFMVAVALSLWVIAPFKLEVTPPSSLVTQTTIGYQNVNISNQNYTQLLTAISQADTLILLEANPTWRDEVRQFNPDYQFICGNNDHSPFAIQIFSKTPISCELLTLVEFPMAKLSLADGRMMFAVHPPPPINHELAMARLEYIQQVKALVQAQASAVLVIGDMNLSAFSPVYRDFIKGTSLQRLTANGLPTWLPLGLSIDQVWTNTRHPYITIKPQAWHGSDHRGLVVDWYVLVNPNTKLPVSSKNRR